MLPQLEYGCRQIVNLKRFDDFLLQTDLFKSDISGIRVFLDVNSKKTRYVVFHFQSHVPFFSQLSNYLVNVPGVLGIQKCVIDVDQA